MIIKLTVAIITYNEERNIKRCLQSVVDIADEVVVIDSFSTDKTESICNEFNVKFIKEKFLGHIEQKNFAILQSSNPYILSLDADECLSEEAIQDILSAKQNWKYDGYVFNRLNNYCGKWIKHGGWYPDKKLRLWDSRKGSWQGENPHDEFKLDSGSKIKNLKTDILHYSFVSEEQHLQQIDYFTTIAAKAAHHKNVKSSYIKALYKGGFKFLRDYILKAGFLDGKYGYIIGRNSAYAKYLKYYKLMQLNK